MRAPYFSQLLVITVMIVLLGCEKDQMNHPEPGLPCEEIIEEHEYWSGLQENGKFSGLFNCYAVNGSAECVKLRHSGPGDSLTVILNIYKFGSPKFQYVTGFHGYTPDSIDLDISHLPRKSVGIVYRDDIERAEDFYSLDTSFNSSITSFFIDSSSQTTSGVLNVRMLVREPKNNSNNPDTLTLIDCAFSTHGFL